ncbi:MAG: 30S ribosomal protein S12 methylthiotransferase RimO [Acidobacteriota bacterium]|nr:30S ribosomal protein S12 methylthiotransferase RimO [Acidobacteriota bacterium]
MAGSYYLESLGCPKNQVDAEKLAGTLRADGYLAAGSADQADLVVVNTCAFVEAARQESVDTILALAEARRPGARLVVTGCLAERYGTELAEALPEVDLVAGFGVPVTLGRAPAARRALRVGDATGGRPVPAFDLLELPRPPAEAPWAYVKVAEGCDRRCGFCAIPSFRGAQRSRPVASVLTEVEALGPDVREVVLVAQDLASWGLDRSDPDRGRRLEAKRRPLVELVGALADRVPRVRLLYLYPSSLDDELVEAMVASGVPYFDLSLQHASKALLRRMRRWGDGGRFLERIAAIREAAPEAALRSSFILGYPGETEEDHDELLAFLAEARLDWAGFFPFSEEPGTLAATAEAGDRVPPELALERLRECAELQDAVTAERRSALVGETVDVLVDEPGVGRSHREAPEIDGIVHVPATMAVGAIGTVQVTGAAGPDLWAVPA